LQVLPSKNLWLETRFGVHKVDTMSNIAAAVANIQEISDITSSVSKTCDAFIQTSAEPLENLKNIRSKSRLVGMTVTQILMRFETDGNDVSRSLERSPELKSTVDSTLTGCFTVYKLFERDLRHWGGRPLSSYDSDWSEKQQLLDIYYLHIRALAQALNLLLSCLHIDSLDDLQRILGQRLFGEIAGESTKLRLQTPDLRLPETLFQGKFGEEQHQPQHQWPPQESQTTAYQQWQQTGTEGLSESLQYTSIGSSPWALEGRAPSVSHTANLSSSYGSGTHQIFELPPAAVQHEDRRPSKPVIMPTTSYPDDKVFLPPPDDEKFLVIPVPGDRTSVETANRSSIASGSSYNSPYFLGRSPPSPFIPPTRPSPQSEVPPEVADTGKEISFFGYQPPSNLLSGLPPLDEDLVATLFKEMEASVNAPDPRVRLDWAEQVLRHCKLRQRFLDRVAGVQKVKHSQQPETERIIKERAIAVVDAFAIQLVEDGGPSGAASGRATFIQARWIAATRDRKIELLKSAQWKGYDRAHYWLGKLYVEDKTTVEAGLGHWEMGAGAGDPACQYVSESFLCFSIANMT
jgi:hypothetical protein